MAFNLTQKTKEFLENNPEKHFTAREIATWIFETYPDQCLRKQMHSTATVNPIDSDQALLQQIVAEIGSQRPRLQKRHPQIKTTEGRPRKYYYTEKTDASEIEEANLLEVCNAQSPGIVNRSEQALYPQLSRFLWSELGIYSKRIDEKRSTNRNGAGGNKWLYPDLVGMEDLSSGWGREIKDCVQAYADKKTKLWSFEVKILVNRSNVRQVFFQAVSNSSWSHFGYLVANDIEGADTLKELRMLSGLHGIGFIKLDSENPSESQIMIPGRIRAEIDWNNANRLAEENADFLEYIKLVRQFYQTGEVRAADWDIPRGG